VLALTYAMDTETKSSSASTSSESFVSAPATQEQPRDNIDDVRPPVSVASTRAAGPFTAPKASPQGSVKKPVEVEQSQGGDDNNNNQSGEEDDEEEQAFLILLSGPSECPEGDDLAEMIITPSTRSGDASAPSVQTYERDG
jgi:hypothetical protein